MHLTDVLEYLKFSRIPKYVSDSTILPNSPALVTIGQLPPRSSKGKFSDSQQPGYMSPQTGIR